MERQELEISEEEIEKELAKQERVADREATRAIDERFKAGKLPPEVEKLMREVLFAGNAKQ